MCHMTLFSLSLLRLLEGSKELSLYKDLPFRITEFSRNVALSILNSKIYKTPKTNLKWQV
jgi:hypothetical protein